MLVFLRAGSCLAANPAETVHVDAQTLAAKPLWLDLLHVNQGALWHGRGQSTVDDPKFFLAARGARDPTAELKADIAAFRRPGDTARCRFPGRYKFVARHLGWQQRSPFAKCPKYRNWRKVMPAKRVVVVFPVGTMRGAASMFGHLFLRLDTRADADASLMSLTVGFLSKTDPDDNPLVRKIKGLSGGYDGQLFFQNYIEQLNRYSDVDSRDMWSYRLNLTATEISRLLDHIWALRGIKSGYFYLDANCAYQLLALLQVTRPNEPLLKTLRMTQVPVNAVRKLQARGFIAGHDYHPSATTKMAWQAQHLSAAEQALAVRVYHSPTVANGKVFRALDKQRRFQVASLALSHFDFATRKAGHTNHSDQQRARQRKRYRLLRLVHANTPAQLLPPAPSPTPPQDGHGTHMWSLAVGQRQHADFVDLQFRYTYHDLLDNPRGFKKGTSINSFGVDLRAYDSTMTGHSSHVVLQSLQLLSMYSLVPGTALNHPTSWFADVGMAQVRARGADHLAAYVQGGPGLTWRYGDFMPYALVKGRFEYNKAYAGVGSIGAGGQAGVLYYRGVLSAQLGLDSIAFTNGDRRMRLFFRANWQLNQNNAVRASVHHGRYRHGHVNQLSLAWRHYF